MTAPAPSLLVSPDIARMGRALAHADALVVANREATDRAVALLGTARREGTADTDGVTVTASGELGRTVYDVGAVTFGIWGLGARAAADLIREVLVQR